MFPTQLRPYRGPALNVTPGSSLNYPRAFVPARGPRKLRNVIHYLEIKCTGNYDSVTTSTIQGEDFCELLATVRAQDAAGRLVQLDGDELRAYAFDQLIQPPEDPADVAVTTTASTVVYRHILPFSLPRLARPHDTALEVDTWLDESFELELTAAGNSTLVTGGTYVLNATTGVTFQVTAWCSEELNYERKARTVVETQATDNDAEFNISGLNGRPIITLFLHKGGASGGASMSNIDVVTIAKLDMNQIPDDMLEYGYKMGRGNAEFQYTKHPFDHNESTDAAGESAFPLLWTPMGCKITQLMSIAGDLNVIVSESSAITSKKVVKAYLTVPSETKVVKNARKNGVAIGSLVTKTINGKSREDNPYAPFLPSKAA